MSKKHIGRNPLQKQKSDSLFTPSEKEVIEEQKQRGRPVQHSEKWTKVTCVLFNSQIAWLDHLAADIRMKSGAALSRAELVRAMISAVQNSGIDLTGVVSEDDAKDHLLSHIA